MKVSFKARGKHVSFTAIKRKRSRKLTAHNRFVAKFIKNHGGSSPRSAMRQANKAWNKS